MRYLVTGASGFVGSHLVDRILELGETVYALVPCLSEAEPLRQRGIDTWSIDLTDNADLTAAVEGMDVVIHCAGAAPMQFGAAPSDVWNVNFSGTKRLLAASAQVDLFRFVYISTSAVYGTGLPPIKEDAPKRPVGAYSESKWAAEQMLWHYHLKHNLPAVALRPCITYGPRDHKFSRGLLRVCQRRIVPLPSGGSHLLDLLYISDLVDAVLAAAVKPSAIGSAYNLTDGERHTSRDILSTYGQVTGRRPAIVPIPGRVLRLLTHGILTKEVRGGWVRRIGGLRMLDLDIHYSIAAARDELGYVPQVKLAEGLHRLLSWSTESGSGNNSDS